jgi:uncharacterized protein (TIGR02246 family)
MATTTEPGNDGAIQLYEAILDAWNRCDAAAFAGLFVPDGNTVGFDGSQMNGQDEIRDSLEAIFRDHRPAQYVGKIREVRSISPDVTLVRAVAGMVPPGGSDLNDDLSIQSLVALRAGDRWRAALWHNTPAAYHGRPDDRAALADELRSLIPSRAGA